MHLELAEPPHEFGVRSEGALNLAYSILCHSQGETTAAILNDHIANAFLISPTHDCLRLERSVLDEEVKKCLDAGVAVQNMLKNKSRK